MSDETDVTGPEEFLPLRPVEFQVLVSLAPGEKHGYAIIQDAEERGEGAAVPGLATLYRALQRMEDDGLLRRVRPDDESDEDRRRRYYELSPLGRRVLHAEARRLATLVRAAGSGALLDGSGEA